MTDGICFTRAQFRRLSDDQCRKLHSGSLEILGRTGVRLYHQPAVDLARKGGAHISEGNRARFTARMVEEALKSVPNQVTLYDRHAKPAIHLGGYCTFFGTGSDCLKIIDHQTGQRRTPVLQDVVQGITLCDALPNVDFVMSLFLPSDVPALVADRYQMEVLLNRTTKPIIFVTPEFDGCVDAVEMAEIVAGGPDALRLSPLVGCYVNVTSGLRHNEEALQKLLFLSGKGLPFTYIPVSLGGAAAPITVAGNMAVWHAGNLVGLVLSQLNREGSPYITSGWGASALDMRRATSPYVEPEKQFVAQELAHSLGLPMFGFGGCCDSKLVDQQAGIEAALTLLTNALAGSHLVHDLGYLESGMTGSLAQLAICDEVVAWIRASLAPVEINDESLALDVIDTVGPDGNFLEHEHTLTRYRTRWFPRLIDRDNYDRWSEKGGLDLAQRAANRVDEILAEHVPEPLPADVRDRVGGIVERAVRQCA